MIFTLFIVSTEIFAEECKRPDKDCSSKDPSPSPIQGQYPTESLFNFPTSFEDFFRRRTPQNLEGESNAFAEVFYPAIKRKGTPEMRAESPPSMLQKFFVKLEDLLRRCLITNYCRDLISYGRSIHR